jgi:hypothetical protein
MSEKDQRIRRELTALNKVMRALLKLPEGGPRERVMRYLYDKYVIGDRP